MANATWAHTNVYGAGKMLATYDNVGLHFHFADWLGTNRVQMNADGAVEETCLSLPFGDSLSCSGPGTDATEHHFTGKERDAESGLDYFGARYFGSNTGRWMSPDWAAKAQPIPYAKMDWPQSFNLYGYVENNPLSVADADGHTSDADCRVTNADKCQRLAESQSKSDQIRKDTQKAQAQQHGVPTGVNNSAGQPIVLPAPDSNHNHTLTIREVQGQNGNTFNHITVQVDGGQEVGFGPVTGMTHTQLAGNAAVPGQVEPRGNVPVIDAVTIYITAGGVVGANAAIAGRVANPENYQVDGRSCVDFGESVGRAAGASMPHDLFPASLIGDIRAQQIMSSSAQTK